MGTTLKRAAEPMGQEFLSNKMQIMYNKIEIKIREKNILTAKKLT